MANDIVPVLNKNIETSFQNIVMKDKRVTRIGRRIRDGTATLSDVHDYSACLGEDLSQALLNNLTTETLPNGILYYNIAERTVIPALKTNYDLVNEMATIVQGLEDNRNNIGLKPITAEFPEERIRGLIDKITQEDVTVDNVVNWLKEPIVNNSESFMDDFVDANAKFREDAGMQAKLIRKAEANCCPWCADLEGEYDYGDAPDDIYRRHEFCRCVVTFKVGKRRQDAWSKKVWETPKEDIEARKAIGSEKEEISREERIEQTNRLYMDKLINAEGVQYSRRDTIRDINKMSSSERLALLRKYEAKRKG